MLIYKQHVIIISRREFITYLSASKKGAIKQSANEAAADSKSTQVTTATQRRLAWSLDTCTCTPYPENLQQLETHTLLATVKALVYCSPSVSRDLNSQHIVGQTYMMTKESKSHACM